ncbi:MAG: hypothetical protein A2015_03240 [Spirochaetes bacterium GWF1_31_7]|nr:MAG: hypothetical protein A2Y30_07325 [Spirochaetes bacterium GWE1_32_154]OHD50872.1 MAG: hypothetical protein A2015_03240 [Spirochaetes bacterium GWF1_31_7]OHD51870.1 MAG: hypothetical protein A2Y29_10485 [Spirochaetes bacterium GWE2_31_10]HBD96417.1 hypothetical protein [Spirochaetia bacterium]HBI38225.1 hypothetical protein [Spirochaetia bacterium]
MDRGFRIFLIISFFLHILAGCLFYSFYIKNRITFKKEENKIIDIKMIKKSDFATHKNSQIESTGTGHQGLQDIITHTIQIDSINNQQSNPNNTINYSISSYNSLQTFKIDKNVNILNKNNIVEPNWDINDYSEGISFTNGEYRKLIAYDTTLLESFEFVSDNEMTLLLTINSEGHIENIDITESTGDMDNDRKISNIISTWRFEKGINLQRGILKLKYFLK